MNPGPGPGPDPALPLSTPGAPAFLKRVNHEDDPLDFAEISRYDRDGCLICASTPGQDTFTESGRDGAGSGGLVPGHAYTVIAARQITRGVHTGAQLLKIRNPWGNFEWDGKWSDNSKEMTDPEVRDEPGP